MIYEWDEAKNRTNVVKRERRTGVSKISIENGLAKLDRLKDSEIDYSDIPPLDESFFRKATVPWPPVKRQLTIRLDVDVLHWLKANGRGYQTRINRILRAAMESQPPEQPRSTTTRRAGVRSRENLP